MIFGCFIATLKIDRILHPKGIFAFSGNDCHVFFLKSGMPGMLGP
jgi:hypothetical protein